MAHAIIPEFGRQKQADLRELEASLGYKNELQDTFKIYRESLS